MGRERGEPKSAGLPGRLTEKVTSPLSPRCGGSPLSPLRLSLAKMFVFFLADFSAI